MCALHGLPAVNEPLRGVLPSWRVRQRGGRFQAGVRGLHGLPPVWHWHLRDPARPSDAALATPGAALATLGAALAALFA